MGTFIYKEAPTVDYYIGWSSVVEAPVFGGIRAEMLAYLARESDPYLRDDAPHHPANRLKRADETGTSSLWVTEAGMRDKYPEDGSWEDVDGHIYMQRGMCSRKNMFVLARRVFADPDADVSDLLTPFEDEVEVRA